MSSRKIIFVYNAKRNLFNMLTDYVHKVVHPSTYQCSLCNLTHTNMGMKNGWKTFIGTLEDEKTFLYKDDFITKYHGHSAITFPAIFLEDNETLHQVMSATELKGIKSLAELQHALRTKLVQV